MLEARGPLAVVATGLPSSGLLRYRVTIDDHAAARDWIAGTSAAISRGSPRVFALRAFQPSARRVYSPPPSVTERQPEREPLPSAV
jgi:hypothetical protein